MNQSFRRGLAALLALVLVLGTFPAGAAAVSLDETTYSTVSQEEDTQTEDTAVASEAGETAEDAAEDTASEPTETETATEAEDTSSSEPDEEDSASAGETASTAEEETEPEVEEDAVVSAAEEAAGEETAEEEAEASVTRTAAYKRSYAKKGTTFRILVIGNSYSVDSTQYLYRVATDAGYDVVVGNLQLSSTTLANHWSYAKNDSAVYTYRKNTSGSWKSTSSVSMSTAVQDEDWDIIIFHQQSIAAGQSSKFYNSSGDNYLTLLADYVTGLCGNADVKIGFEMTWAHIEDCPDSECNRYNNDQMTMYQKICDATQAAVVDSGAVDLIITTGTAIQNVRSSYIGDTLNRDTKHLSYGLGRWLAAMSLASACGMDLSGLTAINSSSSYGVYSSLHLAVLEQSIADAEATPYAVTAQTTTLPVLSSPSVTSSVSSGKTTLTWSAVSGATGYAVYQMANGESDFTLATTLSTGNSSYSYTGSASNSYQVYALGDDYIADAVSNTVAAASNSISLAQPTISSVSNASGNKLTVKWSAVSGATGYQVQTATDSSFTKNVQTATVSGTSKTTSSRTSGTKYYVRVRAYTTVSGTKYYSSWSAVKTIYCVGTPTLSSVSNASSRKLTIKWSSVSSVTGYQVQTATDSSFSKNVQTATVSGTSKTTSSRTNGTKYYVRVRAYKTVSGTKYYSAWSSTKSIYCLSAPSISSLKNVKTKKLTVKWSKNTKATGYQIQYSTSSSFSSYKTVTVSSYKTVSKTISSLTKGKKYYVRVRAYKTVSGTKYYSAWSGKKSVKISK
ncbi:MAG: DUF4886 domain-containing protein [Clostridiales bacterium]|nr:DUF4886 domain-containing protein [Clostridiales bacterium]